MFAWSRYLLLLVTDVPHQVVTSSVTWTHEVVDIWRNFMDKEKAVQVSIKQDPCTQRIKDIKHFRVHVDPAEEPRLEALSKLYAAAAATQTIIFVHTNQRV